MISGKQREKKKVILEIFILLPKCERWPEAYENYPVGGTERFGL